MERALAFVGKSPVKNLCARPGGGRVIEMGKYHAPINLWGRG